MQIIAAKGEKAVAFSAVTRATGLAGASLVQRYGSLQAMVEAALSWGWDELDAAALAAETEVATSDKGPQALLKALGDRRGTLPLAVLLAASLRHAGLRGRALTWRNRVEAMLAARLHNPDSAAMLFAAWQGQSLWEGTGEKSFRLKDVVKRLS